MSTKIIQVGDIVAYRGKGKNLFDQPMGVVQKRDGQDITVLFILDNGISKEASFQRKNLKFVEKAPLADMDVKKSVDFLLYECLRSDKK